MQRKVNKILVGAYASTKIVTPHDVIQGILHVL